MNRIKEIIRERCVNDWDEIFANADPRLSEIYSSYVLSGCIGIIENWIRNGTRQSPEELARYTEDIMLKWVEYTEIDVLCYYSQVVSREAFCHEYGKIPRHTGQKCQSPKVIWNAF